MNLCESLTTLVDAARQTPENPQLNRAIKVIEKKIARLRFKRQNKIVTPPLYTDTAKCVCGAPARGTVTGGALRCCATCAFHPLGCRCQYGDKPDTVNTAHE